MELTALNNAVLISSTLTANGMFFAMTHKMIFFQGICAWWLTCFLMIFFMMAAEFCA